MMTKHIGAGKLGPSWLDVDYLCTYPLSVWPTSLINDNFYSFCINDEFWARTRVFDLPLLPLAAWSMTSVIDSLHTDLFFKWNWLNWFEYICEKLLVMITRAFTDCQSLWRKIPVMSDSQTDISTLTPN